MAGSVLSPEKCIVVDIWITPGNWGKADAMEWAEGSRPGRDMASAQVTTGVFDQGMFSKG